MSHTVSILFLSSNPKTHTFNGTEFIACNYIHSNLFCMYASYLPSYFSHILDFYFCHINDNKNVSVFSGTQGRHTMLLSYLGGPWLVGRAALQVCQDAGEGVDLSIQTGASLLQRLLRSFHLSANMAKGAKQ